MSTFHSNDPEFDDLTEEEYNLWLDAAESYDLQCKCTGEYCVC